MQLVDTFMLYLVDGLVDTLPQLGDTLATLGKDQLDLSSIFKKNKAIYSESPQGIYPTESKPLQKPLQSLYKSLYLVYFLPTKMEILI